MSPESESNFLRRRHYHAITCLPAALERLLQRLLFSAYDSLHLCFVCLTHLRLRPIHKSCSLRVSLSLTFNSVIFFFFFSSSFYRSHQVQNLIQNPKWKKGRFVANFAFGSYTDGSLFFNFVNTSMNCFSFVSVSPSSEPLLSSSLSYPIAAPIALLLFHHHPFTTTFRLFNRCSSFLRCYVRSATAIFLNTSAPSILSFRRFCRRRRRRRRRRRSIRRFITVKHYVITQRQSLLFLLPLLTRGYRVQTSVPTSIINKVI